MHRSGSYWNESTYQMFQRCATQYLYTYPERAPSPNPLLRACPGFGPKGDPRRNHRPWALSWSKASPWPVCGWVTGSHCWSHRSHQRGPYCTDHLLSVRSFHKVGRPRLSSRGQLIQQRAADSKRQARPTPFFFFFEGKLNSCLEMQSMGSR